MKSYQVTGLSHRIISEYVQEGDCCIDATMGNGYDTEFLCRLVGSKGHVEAFDIQKQALIKTEERLKEDGYLSSVRLHLASHECMDEFASPETISCIVFNLGYLPSGDHALATRPETTLNALKKSFLLLKKGGAVVMSIYSGGDSGYEERDSVLAFLKELDTKNFLVILTQYYNRPNDPPMIATIVKLR